MKSLHRTGLIAGLAVASSLLLAGCGKPSAPAAGAAPAARGADPARPKLVLVVVLDQFREDYLTRFAQHLSEDGFKGLARRGATFTGHYGHYVTYTGPANPCFTSRGR